MTHEVGRLLEAVYIQVSMNTVLRIPLDDFILFLKIKSAWSFCIPLPPFWHQFCSCSQEGHLIVSFRLADFAFCFCFSRALYPRCLLAEMVQDLSAANPFILSVTQPLLWLNQTEQGNVTSCFSFFFCTSVLPPNKPICSTSLLLPSGQWRSFSPCFTWGPDLATHMADAFHMARLYQPW